MTWHDKRLSNLNSETKILYICRNAVIIFVSHKCYFITTKYIIKEVDIYFSCWHFLNFYTHLYLLCDSNNCLSSDISCDLADGWLDLTR